jgi:hypothetical protein
MKRIATLAAALVAGLALSAGAADDAAKVHKGEAKRHIWTSDVALEQARIGMQGLWALADDNEGAWDVDHAKTLISGVAREVRLAATHLQHLTNLPADKNDHAITDLTRAQTSLARVQTQLKELERPVQAGMAAPTDKDDKDHGLKGSVRDAWKSLDQAVSDFKKVADDYKVTTRLPTP